MSGWEQLQDFERGIEVARERIIKLLEEHYPQPNDHDFVGCDCDEAGHDWYNKHLIALIKGETNE